MGFIDTMRAQGHAVESVCVVLREQGCQVAGRTYRSWKQAHRPVAARTVTDAQVVNVGCHLVGCLFLQRHVDVLSQARRLSPRPVGVEQHLLGTHERTVWRPQMTGE